MFRTLMSPSVRNAMDEREMGVIEIISSDDEEYAQPSPSGRTGPCSAQAGIRRRRDPPRRTRRQFNPILNDDQSPEVQPCEIVDLTSDTAATAEGAGDCVIVGSVPPPPKRRRSVAPQSLARQEARGSGGATPSINSIKCPICLGGIQNMTSTTCGHVFCQECIKQAVKAQKKCPTCRKPIMLRHLHRIYLT
uniref:Ubiquitin-protein ligase zinc ion binding protein n=1 Tax=Tetraselmis sp. GSL018 TaxID=582737 RepID=A0A061RK57_9CHLO|mmetsp:Transcript_30434/g.72411  ORF Transcript_30434/g.72411 Transcript_30434/m.72411 type:complete len:192 (+) Transcript_30434:572-1147(+)